MPETCTAHLEISCAALIGRADGLKALQTHAEVHRNRPGPLGRAGAGDDAPLTPRATATSLGAAAADLPQLPC